MVSIPVLILAPLLDALQTAAWLRRLLLTAVVVAAYVGYRGLVEREHPRELAMQGIWREAGAGVLCGALAFCLVIAMLAALGVYRIDGVNDWRLLLTAFPGSLRTAVTEEILFRAVVFRILEQRYGSIAALTVSALVFGATHLGNPASTVYSATAIAIEAGVMLAAAYMLTRRLWLCCGLHLGWNFLQGAVFSGAVSGNVQNGFFQSHMSGPEWLTGGAFGVEASPLAVLVCVALGAGLLIAAYRRGQFLGGSRDR